MKKTYKFLLSAVCVSSCLVLTGCIEDAIQTDSAAESEVTLESMVWGMPARSIAFDALGNDYHNDWGQGSLMHTRDVMGDEYVVSASSYDWYQDICLNQYQSQQYSYSSIPFYTLYNEVQQCNLVINKAKKDSSEKAKGFLGAGYGMRAWTYLDIARVYEFLPTEVNSSVNGDGNDVLGLTAPIVTENTDVLAHVARATHYEMFNFILQDLDSAENNIIYLKESNKALPHLNVIYGLKARAYLWHASFLAEGITIPSDQNNTASGSITSAEAFKLAQEYAQKAIDLGENTPLTEAEWTNAETGFNTYASSWMMGMKLVKENDAVQTVIVNWTSWCSNETTYGYAAAGPIVLAASNFYNDIPDTDFRKLSWKAPEGSALSGKESYIKESMFNDLPELASLKFRPGQGDVSDYNVGSAVAIPLMRIEEMYFIAAEAAAQQDKIAEAQKILADFMVNYRDPQYKCYASTKGDLVKEVIRQKRVELWGEGQNFFDTKRLNLSIDRSFSGSTFNANGRFKTNGRPAWMNFVFCQSEINYNEAIKKWNNPDPSQLYKTVSAAPAKCYDNAAMATRLGLRTPVINSNVNYRK